MKNKTLAYIGLGVIVLLLLGTFGMGRMNGKSTKDTEVANDMDHMNEQSFSSSSEDLAKYRSEDIPEECRLPGYDNNVNKWKEHLSHHEDTLYCLDYYDK